MKKSWLWLASMLLVLALFLAACGGSDDEETDTDTDTDDTEQQDDTEDETEGDTGPQQGGTLTYAIASGPTGPIDINYYGSATEAEVNQFVQEPLFKYDENLELQPYLADWETEDFITYDFTLQEGIKWHNGDELTMHDWVLALHVLADADYTGPRYTNVSHIVGAEEYRNGEADSIEGITVHDDYNVTIEFVEARVNNLLNLWFYPMNTTVFGDMPVADMEEDPAILEEIIGTGPFQFENARTGEYYELTAFEDYWGGAPNLDKIVVQVVPNESVIGALETSQIDLVAIAPRLASQAEEFEHIELLTAPGLTYYYIGFRLGIYDHDEGDIVGEFDKFADKRLRQAMWYAIDREPWLNEFFGEHSSLLQAPTSPAHWTAADPSDLNAYEYNPEKAKELLEEAGYVDQDGDGFVEDPDGNEFTVEFSHYDTGDEAFAIRSQAIVDYWRDVGINASVNMVPVDLYYDTLEWEDPSDAPVFETFFGGWGTGADPDPTGLWATTSRWNFPRFYNERADEILKDALNLEVVGTDPDEQMENRKALYSEWQQILNEEVPMIIFGALDEVWAQTDRVKNITVDVSGWNNPSEWYIVDEE